MQKYEYKYGQTASGSLDSTKNNGQLAQVESWIGTEQQYRQQYSYDTLGRLTESIEKYGTSLASTAYDLKYKYDVSGNRQQRQSDNSGNTAITQKWVESGDISTPNNRFSCNVTYDAAGNITADPRFRNLIYGYDANGRQNYAAAANGSGPVTAVFDGADQRAANKAGGVLNIMIYDAGGKLVAEYGVTAPTIANLQYVTADYQGSTRVVTDSSGAVANRHDYLPFGEDIGAGVGTRTTGKMFSQTDSVRQKYAGMETDDATGMAHTLWRKQDNLSGRWTSPDPYGGSMSIADPQSFNRYIYCNNDPVNQVDPSGLYPNDYHDASSGWGDVSGYFWGDGSFDTNTRRSAGRATIGNAEHRHDSMVNQARALQAFSHAYNNHDYDGARAIMDANPSIGYFEERDEDTEGGEAGGSESSQDGVNDVSFVSVEVISPVDDPDEKKREIEISGLGATGAATINLENEIGGDGKKVPTFVLRVNFVYPYDGTIDKKGTTVTEIAGGRWGIVSVAFGKVGDGKGSIDITFRQRDDEGRTNTAALITVRGNHGKHLLHKNFHDFVRLRIITNNRDVLKSQRSKP